MACLFYFAETKQLSKKEKKALEDAEFEAMMAGITPESKKDDSEKKAEAPQVGEANAKNKKKKEKAKAKAKKEEEAKKDTTNNNEASEMTAE